MKLITDKLKNGFTNPEFTEYLQTAVPKTEFTQDEAYELQKTLEEGMLKYPGVGLSANQLGINKRACIINIDGTSIFLLNPFIKERDKEAFLFLEGCLSIPKTIQSPVKTIRSMRIVVQTDNLGELEFKANLDSEDGFMSPETLRTVIAQHEIDHLDGITIRDRVYTTTVKKKMDFGRNEKIMMKSPEGEFIEVKYKKANNYYLKGYEII
jgi:peptide deformylase